jgi:hypothetical protein
MTSMSMITVMMRWLVCQAAGVEAWRGMIAKCVLWRWRLIKVMVAIVYLILLRQLFVLKFLAGGWA